MPARSVAELVGNAVRLRQITKAQANALLRHRKHHSEGHMLHMLQLMAIKHLSFKEAEGNEGRGPLTLTWEAC